MKSEGLLLFFFFHPSSVLRMRRHALKLQSFFSTLASSKRMLQAVLDAREERKKAKQIDK